MMEFSSMRIIDISMDITPDMPVYGGKEYKRPVFHVDRNFTNSTAYETRLEINMHTGTHVDAPMHMIEGGENINGLRLEQVVTRCTVLDFEDVDEKITRAHLEKKNIGKGDFILLKTKNSFLNILEGSFIYLDKTGAEYLSEKGISGVGIDALGVERSQPEHETHKILLGAGIVVLEGLRLKEAAEGEYLLVSAPIKLLNVEAAPARALLVQSCS